MKSMPHIPSKGIGKSSLTIWYVCGIKTFSTCKSKVAEPKDFMVPSPIPVKSEVFSVSILDFSRQG